MKDRTLEKVEELRNAESRERRRKEDGIQTDETAAWTKIESTNVKKVVQRDIIHRHTEMSNLNHASNFSHVEVEVRSEATSVEAVINLLLTGTATTIHRQSTENTARENGATRAVASGMKTSAGTARIHLLLLIGVKTAKLHEIQTQNRWPRRSKRLLPGCLNRINANEVFSCRTGYLFTD